MIIIKRHHLPAGLLFAVALSSVPPAFAAEAAKQPRVDVIVSRSDVAAAQAVQAIPLFERSYAMTTGARMSVASHGGSALRVRYGDQPATTLRHDGQGRFVSQDGLLALRFELDDAGDPQRVRLNMPSKWQ
ncbi:MAG: hypothetical protein ABI564_01955 [Ideonella sp.]